MISIFDFTYDWDGSFFAGESLPMSESNVNPVRRRFLKRLDIEFKKISIWKIGFNNPVGFLRRINVFDRYFDGGL